jgi:DNA mismatch repair protein MutL
MPRILQLPPDVVAKIAAGEVVERPASVVKELLENSVDAGSTRIDIDLEQGGTELIRVADDGCGIAAADLPLAFASHATSKLRDADDLFRVGTMGFRGEALASIGGVAKVLVQSRPRGEPGGAELRSDGGTLGDVRPWNGSPGTRVEAKHLFFNVPVRRKFLKSIPTELGHVCETVTRLALANPTLHITLRHNGKLVYEVPGSAGLTDRVKLFFGADVRDALLDVDTGPGPARLAGYVADPKCDRGNPKLQYLFVNGRWVRDRSLGHAWQEAYRGLLMTGRYAVGLLFLEVPPDQVDVNVHPTKSEVRFRDNSAMYSLVRAAVKARLLKANLVPQLAVPPQEDRPQREWPGVRTETAEPWALSAPPANRTDPLFGPRRVEAERTAAPWEEVLPPSPRWGEGLGVRGNQPAGEGDGAPPGEAGPLTPGPSPQRGEGSQTEPAPPFPLPALPPGAALQVHDAYLVLETPDGMLVIDQHALHERILYEQLRRRVRDGKLEVQRLLIPEPVELPAAQAAAVLAAADQLRELGLDVSDFGGDTVLLSSYPTLLGRRPPHEILLAVVDHLVTKDRPPSKEALLDGLLATMACKAAVKAGDRLTPDEISHLLHLRDLADDSHHCPHGRPTSLLFSRKQLDRQFGRI